jgi:hypothetical protein
MQFVLIYYDVVWSGAEDFGQLAAHSPAEEIHLPETIGGGGVTLGEVEIVIVLRFDVGNASLIAVNRDIVLDTFNLD